MGLDKLELGSGTLFMTTTDGTDIMQVQTHDVYCDIPFSADAEPDYEFEFKIPLAQEFTVDSAVVDQTLLQHVMEAPNGWHMEYEANILVQARRHRKKRINKKWAKRYGYKTARQKVKFDCAQVTFEQDADTWNITFETKGIGA